MRVKQRIIIGALCIGVAFLTLAPTANATEGTEDLTTRLQEIYALRAQWLLTDGAPASIDPDYLPGASPARWALDHEHAKFRYMKQWALNRKVRFVVSRPSIKVKRLTITPDRARFYVEQSLALGYVYPNEEQQVNEFGVGTRHIIELRRRDDKWLIGMEWYTDPLGDDTEVPDVMPAMTPEPLPPATPVATKRYDREGAVRYADQYCGVAWGCGNNNRYNPRYRDYNGVGGDCTNYISQALKDGGHLNVPIHTRVGPLSAYLQYSGRAVLATRGPFRTLAKVASSRPEGFTAWINKGDLITYQEKGEMVHFVIVTGFDSRGYPLVNSHTADRHHVPFDLGWDRKTIYWLYRVRD